MPLRTLWVCSKAHKWLSHSNACHNTQRLQKTLDCTPTNGTAESTEGNRVDLLAIGRPQQY